MQNDRRRIPFVDIRGTGAKQLVMDYPDKAKELIAASRHTLGLFSDLISRIAFPPADKASYEWLLKTNNPYFDEINFCARHLDVPGVFALNMCLEWGCTSSVYAMKDGPTLVRVLDWIFPKLGESVIVAQQRGPAGDFYNMTWPGFSGMLQGVAPGRFAASINQAPRQMHRLTAVGDWLKNRKQVYDAKGLPPAHLLRKIFEDAKTYDEAKELLSKAPIAMPIIYVLSGMQPGEGCVIERTENTFAIKPMENDRACASNQFETELKLTGHGWRPRPANSAGRLYQAYTMSLSEIDDQFNWFKPPIANANSRLAFTACAGTGALSIFGAFGREKVTDVLTLKS